MGSQYCVPIVTLEHSNCVDQQSLPCRRWLFWATFYREKSRTFVGRFCLVWPTSISGWNHLNPLTSPMRTISLRVRTFSGKHGQWVGIARQENSIRQRGDPCAVRHRCDPHRPTRDLSDVSKQLSVVLFHSVLLKAAQLKRAQLTLCLMESTTDCKGENVSIVARIEDISPRRFCSSSPSNCYSVS